MDQQEAPKPRIEFVKTTPNTPRGRNHAEEINGILEVIGRIDNILVDYPDTIQEIKASIENNTEQVSTLITSFETYKQTTDQKIDENILANATDVQSLKDQLLSLKTFTEEIKSQLYRENADQEGKIKALQELLAKQESLVKNSSVSANSSAPNFVKLFGTISAINFVGLILVFSIWLNSHLGSR